MHLVPADRAHRRVIDEHTVCDALAGLSEASLRREWSALFAVLGDPHRLTLLQCIHAAPGICVTDLAVAADMNDSTVSQALRFLRGSGLVHDRRDGRIMRYHLADDRLHTLLHLVQGRARDATPAEQA
jgi:DNA-binding transcriptional ArsR family regulator